MQGLGGPVFGLLKARFFGKKNIQIAILLTCDLVKNKVAS